jgi:hypothetical protein
MQRFFLEVLKKPSEYDIFINPSHWIKVPQDQSQLEVSELELLYLRLVMRGTWEPGPKYNHKYVLQPSEIIFPALARDYTNWIT